MITFDNGVMLIESEDELPELPGDDVFSDMETTSADPKLTSFNPWHNCWVAGIGIAVDDGPVYYVPTGHFDKRLDHDTVCDWFSAQMQGKKRWINHNVKYDAMVAFNCLGYDPSEIVLVDTVVLSKIIDSDRLYKGGYGLDVLSRDWLHEDISKFEKALQPYLKNEKGNYYNRDYGNIPHDICGEYGGQDILSNRRLWKYINAQCPDQCRQVWNTEIELTSLLFEMEVEGMPVDKTKLMLKEVELLQELLDLDSQIAEIVGRSMQPTSNDDCYEVLCNQYGLPVLGWTRKKEPSFDKHALGHYLSHPYAPHDLVELILKYRQRSTLLQTFVRPYQELQVDNVLHGTFNQAVRTGRMSMKKPNMMQCSSESKELIEAGDGYTIISCDASQVEFRLIAHYLNDVDCITAYAEDPDTDFHQWVADLCGIPRKPAKNVNFAIAFGQGKKATVAQLSTQHELIHTINDAIKKLVDEGKIDESESLAYFNMLAKKKGEKVFRDYHAKLPALKQVSRKAASAIQRRGYVFNICGRRRHIPKDRAHIAFNTLNQGSAADLIKQKMVELGKQLEPTPVSIINQVHDEIVMRCPTKFVTDELLIAIVAVLEQPIPGLRVPLRWAIGHSSVNWKLAGDNSTVLQYDPETAKLPPELF